MAKPSDRKTLHWFWRVYIPGCQAIKEFGWTLGFFRLIYGNTYVLAGYVSGGAFKPYQW